MWTPFEDAGSRSRVKLGPARAHRQRACALHLSEDCVLPDKVFRPRTYSTKPPTDVRACSLASTLEEAKQFAQNTAALDKGYYCGFTTVTKPNV